MPKKTFRPGKYRFPDSLIVCKFLIILEGFIGLMTLNMAFLQSVNDFK